METILEVKNLFVNYGSTCVLEDINLTIHKNDFLGIIGPNGGGKTTLLKSLIGFIKPVRGSIQISNNSNTKIGYVPQHTKFNRDFPINVMDVILSGLIEDGCLLFRKFSKAEKISAYDIIEQMGISELKNRQIGQLSGGQLQKVLLARTLLGKPDLILLDEPTASMDALSKTNIYDILYKLSNSLTIVVVTHDTNFISTHIKTIACLNKKLFYHGEPKLSEDIIQEVYGCPVELIAHGKLPHRVLKKHGDD